MSQRQGKVQLPQPPVVMDVGCSCRTPRLISSLLSSLKSRARGLGGGGKHEPPQHASSAWASSTATAVTPSATSTAATTASSSLMDHASSWGSATYAANANALYEGAETADAEERRRRRRQRTRRTSRRSRCRREQGSSTLGEPVELDSAAPYEDFRESMVTMVTEKEMYAWEDLNALLHQFLALNSPRHHPLILGAFADLWAPRGGLFCPPSPCLL